MDYTELTIFAPKEKVDNISAFLIAGGYDTFEICDVSDIVERAGEMFCDYIEDDLLKKKNDPPCIRFYCDIDGRRAEEIRKFILGVCVKIGWNEVFCSVEKIFGSDCDTRWKKYFVPFPVGKKLFIKPSWEPDAGSGAEGRKIIEIDPAAAFGSGTHATTRLCLETLEDRVESGMKVLDMGAGSGILGIGALKMGAESVTAIDIDESAVRTCRENFIKNGCGEDSFVAECRNVLEDREYAKTLSGVFDVVLANIVAGVICLMADILYSSLKKGGVLIASGILAERKEEVKNALTKAGFTEISSKMSEEWVCLEMQK